MSQNNVRARLVERLALLGSRGTNFCRPESHETVTDEEGSSIASEATKVLRESYGMPFARIVYKASDQGGYVFHGNLAAGSRQRSGLHQGTQRILGDRR